MLNGIYVSDRARTMRSESRYTHCMPTLNRCDRLSASESSPVGAEFALTHSPTPTPINSEPTIAARSGICAICGQSGGKRSNIA